MLRRLPLASLAATALLLAGGAPASAASLGSRLLRSGAHGADVAALQRLLVHAGCHLRVDGRFGSATYHCARWFEHSAGLQVDGVVTPTVLTALHGALAQTEAGGAAAAPGVPAGAASAALPAAPAGSAAPASVTPQGLATIPAGLPPAVASILTGGNAIATTPYEWGGGHASWDSPGGYDCSGSVSYALHAAGLLDSPLVSGAFAHWGDPGPGTFVTIYANDTHVWMVVDGVRFDTGGLNAAHPSRWQASLVSTTGYSVVHPPGL